MALIAGNLHKRIEELEASLDTVEQRRIKAVEAHADELTRLKAEHEAKVLNMQQQYAEAEQLILKVNQESRLRREDDFEQERAAWRTQIANLDGRLEQSEKSARKWWALANGWRWHSGGSVEIEGVVYRLMEARTDNPLANFRVPVVEGADFP